MNRLKIHRKVFTRIAILSLLILPADGSGKGTQKEIVQAPVANNRIAPLLRVNILITGIPGDGPGGAIDAFAYSEGLRMPEGVPEGSPPDLQDIVIAKLVDRASVPLRTAVTQGRHLNSATFTLLRIDPETRVERALLIIALRDVRVTSLSLNFQSAMGQEVEELSFTYSRVVWTYNDGVNPPLTTCWDRKTLIHC